MSDAATISSIPSKTGFIAEPKGQDVNIAQEVLKRRQRQRWLWWSGALAIFMVVAIWVVPELNSALSQEAVFPRERLRFATVTRGQFISEVVSQGVIVAAVSPTLFASSAGTVTLTVDAGDSVSEGDVLATVESPELTNNLAKEQASLEALATDIERQVIENRKTALRNQQNVDLAKLALASAERELRRVNLLKGKNIISEQDFEKAEDDVDRAKIEFKHAQQTAELELESLAFDIKSLRQAQTRQQLVVDNLQRLVDELTLRAPVNGIVGTVSVEQKESVAANSAIVTVVDLSAFEVETQVPENYSDDLGIGMAALIEVGNKVYPGSLRAVSPEVTDNTVVARMVFDGEMPAGLRQNQRVTSRIVLEQKQGALILDRGGFLESGSGRVAYVVEGNRAVRRAIEVGSTSIKSVEILAGLSEGDEVVISDTSNFENRDAVGIKQ